MDWREWRARLIGNPRFRQRIARIWPFTLIARRQARRLFDISAGFVYSQTLMACVELGWFERLAHGPADRDALDPDDRLGAEGLERLVAAAIALDLLESRPRDQVGLGMLGAALLGDRGITAMAAHHDLLYADMANPLALLRGEMEATALGNYWGYANEDPASLKAERVQAYSALMADSQPMVAEQVLAAFDFSSVDTLLDVGGGTGAFVKAVSDAHSHIDVSIFDLPGVADLPLVEQTLKATRYGGDFCRDPIPSGADVVSLIRIIHDHDDEVIDRLLTNIRQNMQPGARLLIAEPLAGIKGAETVGDVYFAFYLRAMGSGKARNINQINELMVKNGFAPVTRHRTAVPLICSVLTTNPV